jgi:D-glycero-alpha-D-manno-heptose-7-phosphate kinase
MIITRAPYRISLVGGGTDFPRFFDKHDGAVVSFAIDKHIYTCVSPRFEGDWRVSYTQLEIVDRMGDIRHDIIREALYECGHPTTDKMEIVTVGDLPGKSGLGSSSAVTVSFLKALRPELTDGQLAELACHIEIDRNGAPIGIQDQYATAFGGMNILHFSSDGVNIEPITSDVCREVLRRLTVVHTGELSDSEEVLKPMKKNMRRRTHQLCCMRELAYSLGRNLQAGRYDAVGEALAENWELKKQLADGITTPAIDELYEFAQQNGADAGKISGSGGGGFLLLWSNNLQKRRWLQATLLEEGLSVLDFDLDTDGVTVVFKDGGRFS